MTVTLTDHEPCCCEIRRSVNITIKATGHSDKITRYKGHYIQFIILLSDFQDFLSYSLQQIIIYMYALSISIDRITIVMIKRQNIGHPRLLKIYFRFLLVVQDDKAQQSAN